MKNEFFRALDLWEGTKITGSEIKDVEAYWYFCYLKTASYVKQLVNAWFKNWFCPISQLSINVIFYIWRSALNFASFHIFHDEKWIVSSIFLILFYISRLELSFPTLCLIKILFINCRIPSNFGFRATKVNRSHSRFLFSSQNRSFIGRLTRTRLNFP